jgi:3-carboxy-cis,cis-muconate cycloisomerase
VHWGATSQDILDTACILQCRDALQLLKIKFNNVITALHKHKLIVTK